MTISADLSNRKMRVVRSGAESRAWIHEIRSSGLRVGLVPTMGALHDGHLSLVRRAHEECGVVAATIFVNPTQFGPNEDFTAYPRTLERDLEHLERNGTRLVFVPDRSEIYPTGFSTYVEPPGVAQLWEGQKRPGHFRGVCTVVLKIFQFVPAHVAFFGDKDFQQVQVIRRMTADLALPIEIRSCPTIREPDGLAMSSRNVYLNADERQRAVAISRGMRIAQEMVEHGEREAAAIEARMRQELASAGIHAIDYVAVVDPETLEPSATIDSERRLLIAARVGTTRLIDNCQLAPRR